MKVGFLGQQQILGDKGERDGDGDGGRDERISGRFIMKELSRKS